MGCASLGFCHSWAPLSRGGAECSLSCLFSRRSGGIPHKREVAIGTGMIAYRVAAWRAACFRFFPSGLCAHRRCHLGGLRLFPSSPCTTFDWGVACQECDESTWALIETLIKYLEASAPLAETLLKASVGSPALSATRVARQASYPGVDSPIRCIAIWYTLYM